MTYGRKTMQPLEKWGGRLEYFSNIVADGYNTGVTELSLTLPKGVYLCNVHQLIKSNNQEVVYLKVLVDNVQQTYLSTEYAVPSGSWKNITSVCVLNITSASSSVTIDFNRTIYYGSFEAYKVGN